MANLTLSHGELVLKGRVAASSFLKEAIEKAGGNRKFSGTIGELERITEAHLESWEPGTGAVDGDVRLVQVPTDGFLTDIVEITDANKDQLEVSYNPRREGEAPVPTIFVRGGEPVPASRVQIVVYRADVLARDSDRSSEAEWEIVAILADPQLPEGMDMVPMNPHTMARNAAHATGGTLRSYTNEQWFRAVNFWASHARVVPLGEEPEVG